jgi:hypothetical protein
MHELSLVLTYELSVACKSGFKTGEDFLTRSIATRYWTSSAAVKSGESGTNTRVEESFCVGGPNDNTRVNKPFLTISSDIIIIIIISVVRDCLTHNAGKS